mmetsp:Transcript_18353/g.23799  ORF Transcript_18353/g.23799 Transcript_18353/m.23799 type:complete len:337 (-) Transcript_18353:65-1075(-)|eukprot:CAMPEP_0116068920 /NCGR_PEP_ID=MMETSP0322-20121206/11957_1 /TAXON_ID=163516 /ORGANISM="Leptocylindrus danicus var. apora, Strain B651" /LENGTH=336 /DNA_ID=CAMNT_0003556141 /DNA_START=93 /DNA_END=1103 /DNA_ORIENTATION=+
MITKSSLVTLASIAYLSKTRGLAVLNRYTFLTSTASSMMGVFGTGYEGSSPSADGGWSVCENGDGKCDANAKNPRYIDRDIQMNYGEDGSGNPRTRGLLVRRFTGDSTPFSFPVKPVRLVKEWPKEPPFTEKDFERADEIFDGSFYAVPRFVYHIDEPAVSSLTQFYRNNIKPKSDILDICSSWVSHYPLEFKQSMKRISATGMNKLELQANDQLTDWQQRDLNDFPELPYGDNEFDVVTCVVSIDYLNKPIEILKEVHRVLRKGGKVIISQSNRCFPSKAISMWLKMNDRQHLELINGYFQYAGGFEPREAFDITAEVPDSSYNDPMFIVTAVKK